MKHICPKCGKEFEGRKERKYCSYTCSSKSTTKFVEMNKKNIGKTYEEIYGEEKAKEIKTQMSLDRSCSLKERGWSDEAIQKSIDRTTKYFREVHTGKTYEEIYGEEKAKEIKEKMIFHSNGDNNPMSLQSIAKRKDCSLEEAHFLTPAIGRSGELHPMFGEHHSVESKIQMMNSFEENGSYSSYHFSCGYFDNTYWQGTYELKYLIDNIENEIPIKRYDLKPLYYEDDEKKPHHYFPDFILNESTIIEIKGNEGRENTENKKNAGIKTFGDKYIYINDIRINTKAKLFLRTMKEKYGDRLNIKYNPYEKEINENS